MGKSVECVERVGELFYNENFLLQLRLSNTQKNNLVRCSMTNVCQVIF